MPLQPARHLAGLTMAGFASMAIIMPTATTASAAPTPIVMQAAASTSTFTITASSAYSQIKALQHLLTAYGHPVTTDGILGPKTTAAIKAFQTSKGLNATGIAEPHTMTAMLQGSNVAVKIGWPNKSTVQAAQQLLVMSGYTTPVDGNANAAFEAKLRAFQTNHKLPATGVVNQDTWNTLFNPPAKPSPTTGLRKGPVVQLWQYGTGLASWHTDCAPTSLVMIELRLGMHPTNWSDVAHRGAAINYARRDVMHMYNPNQGTEQINGNTGVVTAMHRLGLTSAKVGSTQQGLAALRAGGVAMLTGDLAVSARWQGQSSSSVGHAIAVLDYRSNDGKYLIADPARTQFTPTWVTASQLETFTAGRSSHAAAYIS